MNSENPDTIIADLHRIREEIAAEFDWDLFAITADARMRMEQSGKKILRRSEAPIRSQASESVPSE